MDVYLSGQENDSEAEGIEHVEKLRQVKAVLEEVTSRSNVSPMLSVSLCYDEKGRSGFLFGVNYMDLVSLLYLKVVCYMLFVCKDTISTIISSCQWISWLVFLNEDPIDFKYNNSGEAVRKRRWTTKKH